jgi:hypothetical protein
MGKYVGGEVVYDAAKLDEIDFKKLVASFRPLSEQDQKAYLKVLAHQLECDIRSFLSLKHGCLDDSWSKEKIVSELSRLESVCSREVDQIRFFTKNYFPGKNTDEILKSVDASYIPGSEKDANEKNYKTESIYWDAFMATREKR